MLSLNRSLVFRHSAYRSWESALFGFSSIARLNSRSAVGQSQSAKNTAYASAACARQACRRVLAPSLPLLSPSESCRWGKDNSIRLQARSKSQPDPHRPERSRALCRLLVGNTRCPSLARLLLFGLRDTCPSNKADKPRDLSRTSCSNASFLRSSAEPADFQIQQLRSPVGQRGCQPASGCTADPKAVCLRVRPRVRAYGEVVAPLNDPASDQRLHAKLTRHLLRFNITLFVTESRRARDNLNIRESR